MLVDDRKNYFMMGLSISLLSHLPQKWWFLLSMMAIIFLMSTLLKKYNVLGEGDINTLTWIMIGYGIISVYILFWFFIIFTVTSIIYFIIKKAFKYTSPTPFYLVILLSFILNAALYQLY
jgi:hypothetical protein